MSAIPLTATELRTLLVVRFVLPLPEVAVSLITSSALAQRQIIAERNGSPA
jgi:hypothetical protein